MRKYVAYYRVSTQRQGQSGLGLSAQQSSAIKFINGGSEIISSYTEVESGKNDKRIELQKAIDDAKKNDATLLIAKLDRLSRNASFIFTLRDAGVKFVCADMPDANSFTIGIFALLAQQEREMISSRTRLALQEKKAQGVKLGTPKNLTDYSRQNSIIARKVKAENDNSNVRALALINSLQRAGYSYRQIANELNKNNFKTSRGNIFYANSVKQLFSRTQKESAVRK